jgi:hypothetical protein
MSPLVMKSGSEAMMVWLNPGGRRSGLVGSPPETVHAAEAVSGEKPAK